MNNLKELFEGLKPITETDNTSLVNELQEARKEAREEQLYYTLHVPRNFGTNFRVDENLTEAEAQALIQEDMRINPKAQKYMLIYKKQN